MTATELRFVCRLMDLAVARCEEANLREQLEVPRWVADLLVQLQAAAGEQPRIPSDTIEAHGWLLDARERYMPDISSLQAAEDEPPTPTSCDSTRRCRHCGHQIRETNRWECANCRKVRRLLRRVQGALAS
jgi:hypothetical protein